MGAHRLPVRRLKFGNVPTVVDNIRFDSKLEARRYQELRLLEKAGSITGLRVHPKFALVVTGTLGLPPVRVGVYEADFAYWVWDRKGKMMVRREIVEDTKSPVTRRLSTYRMKKLLMKAIYGIEIVELGKEDVK